MGGWEDKQCREVEAGKSQRSRYMPKDRVLPDRVQHMCRTHSYDTLSVIFTEDQFSLMFSIKKKSVIAVVIGDLSPAHRRSVSRTR